jgi:hypothetical protein
MVRTDPAANLLQLCRSYSSVTNAQGFGHGTSVTNNSFGRQHYSLFSALNRYCRQRHGIAGSHGAMPHEGWLVPGGMTIICGTKIFAKKIRILLTAEPLSLKFITVGGWLWRLWTNMLLHYQINIQRKQLMKSLIRVILVSAIVALWVGSAVPLSAQTVIYNNTTNDLMARFNPGTTQVGNEILLPATSPGFLTDFSFEYWGTNTASPGNVSFAGPVTAEVRFYVNNGAPFNRYNSPGTMFFDSGPISLASIGATPTARSTLAFTAGPDFPSSGLIIPTYDMTWTVQFAGLGATDSVGVDLYSPATVGETYGDYWAYNGTSWALETNSIATSFGAYMAATVPEPSTLSLSLLGGMGMLALARRLRRKD